MKKAYFIDLDNTVYFTKPYARQLMGSLYKLLAKQDLGVSEADFVQAKADMLHTPFQKVAAKYKFKQAAVDQAVAYLKESIVEGGIAVHNEYRYLKNLPGLKFIVTAGFTKVQLSKVEVLGIIDDFEAIYVVDISLKKQTKKDVFKEIMQIYNFKPEDILIIGDDPYAEILFGRELGIDTFLFDPEEKYDATNSVYHSKTLKDLEFIKNK